MKLKKILVPFDFTDASFNSLEIAAQLAQRDQATVSIIYVVDVPVGGGTSENSMTGSLVGIGSFIDHPHDAKEEEGALLLHMVPRVRERYETIKEKYAETNFEEHIKPDSYQRHLYKFITEEKADLTILKTSEASDVGHSKAAEIIRHSPNPVMTIHEQSADFHPKNIVFESDFEEIDDKQITYLKYFHEIFGAEIHFLKIVTPGFFLFTKDVYPNMEKFAKRVGINDYRLHILNASSVEQGILDFTHMHDDAELIIKTSHAHSKLTKWLYSSSVESIAIHADVPIITI